VSIFIHLAVVASQSRAKFPSEFDLVAVQGHRSWCQSKANVRLPISH